MTDLVLTDVHQQALRHLLAAQPCPGTPLPPPRVLEHVAVLIPADGVVARFYDRASRESKEVSVGRPHPTRPTRRAVLDLELVNRSDALVSMHCIRHWTAFHDRDHTMARLVTPALARLVHERPAPSLPDSLTAQERTVLGHVVSGASNAQIARELYIAESTVRKHLEHAYRKLGVTGRVAAVARLQERDLPDLDLRERIHRVV